MLAHKTTHMSDFSNLSINDSEGRPTTPTNATPNKESEQKKPVKTPNSLKIEKEGSADIKKGMYGLQAYQYKH